MGLGWLTAGTGLAAAVYAAHVGAAWSRYGHVPRHADDEADPLLDRFIPEYEVVERHHARIAAPPAITLAAAREMDLLGNRIVRAIFKGREFIGVPPEAFAVFAEPGYVKIAWTLRADPDGASASVFRSETRALATDPASRARFRLYWSFLSPGIILIRRLMLRRLKADAERRSAEFRIMRQHVEA